MRIRRIGVEETPWQRRRRALVDWLGACKPLDLILGSMLVITVLSMIVRAL